MAISRSVPPGKSSDVELIARVRAGDQLAFEAIFREHYDGMCVFARRFTESAAVAEDVVQDVLLRIWRGRASWNVAGSIASYLYAAVRNQALNELRRDRNHSRWKEQEQVELVPAPGQPDLRCDAEDQVATAEIQDALAAAIQLLPARCREAFVLRRQHHLSYAEIAQVMEIAPKTVEIQIGNALRILRQKLANWV